MPDYKDTPEFADCMREVLASWASGDATIPVDWTAMCGHCGARPAFWRHVALIPHKSTRWLLTARRYFAARRRPQVAA